MDPNLYRALTSSGSGYDLPENKDKLGQVTGSGNTVLHLASQYGGIAAVRFILTVSKELLLKRNKSGELPIHLAAKGGHVSVAKALIDSATSSATPEDVEGQQENDVSRMLRQQRYRDMYTALHEAVRYKRVEIAKMLIEADPDYHYSSFDETPLYLAARRGFSEMVSVILDTCKSPAFTNRNRTTAFHAAILSNSKECLGLLLKWKPFFSENTDINGKTPMHYIAHLGYADLVSQMISTNPHIRYCYTRDTTGKTALLIAAMEGHVSVMKEIIFYSPDCWDEISREGYNILHLAVLHKREDVIQYILQHQDFDVTRLVNQQDIDGNTPLHSSLISNYYVPALISHPMLDTGVLNYRSKTPLDLLTPDSNLSTETKTKIAEELKSAGATYGFPYTIKRSTNKPPQHFHRKQDTLKIVQKSAKTHIIVTTLIATITFAAGFAMPGGYIQSDSKNNEAGMSVLTKSTPFRVFIISDTVAFLLSTAAISMYYVASLHAVAKRIFQFLFVAIFLNLAAILATMIAFIAGTYAVLRNTSELALSVCVLGSCYFVIYIALALIFLNDFVRGKIFFLKM